MAVVLAFKTLPNTTNAGLTAYFRATGCTAVTIGDVLPLLSTVTIYEQEYVIGEMKIWDSGSESSEPNNCAMVRVMVYNDGWIVAWFDEETVTQRSVGGATFVGDQILNIGAGANYDKQNDGMLVEVTASTPADSECPNGTIFCIRNLIYSTNQLQVHKDRSENVYHFNTGHTYDLTIRQSNGNLVWWGHGVDTSGSSPPNLSNRLYRAIYEMWESLKESSNSTDTTDMAISSGKLYRNDGSTYYDYTSEINNDIVDDVPLAMWTIPQPNDAFYYGYDKKFGSLKLNVGIAAVGGTFVWEYWDGSSWQTLSVTDGTSNYTSSGINTVTFIPPSDWEKINIYYYEAYYIRTRVTVNFSTIPYLTQGWIEEPSSLEYSNSNLGMYSFEDTSANYCLICGIYNHISSYGSGAPSDKFFYNTALLGKIIYSHSISYGAGIYRSSSGWGINTIYINSKLVYHTNDGNHVGDAYEAGYRIHNIENIDTSPGSQNVYKVYHYIQPNYHGTSFIYLSSVLITS